MESHFQPPYMRSTSWMQNILNQGFHDSQKYVLHISTVEHRTSLRHNLTDLRSNLNG